MKHGRISMANVYALNKFHFLSAIFIFLNFNPAFSQIPQLNPGVERWKIKTSLPENPREKYVSINDLLRLDNPIEKNDKKYNTSRIPFAVGPDSLKEGDLITTTAWLHLVALENDRKTHRDGDYHIQLRNSPIWADSCLIIEVPLAKFVSDPALRDKCGKVREFVRDNLLKGREPGTSGNKIGRAVYVTVTGQLFFDATHVKGSPRGKKGMKSYTPWELHPVISMKFAPKP
jgi:hypothetical protein